MSLRLRILLLVAAINVGVLMLVVQAAMRSGPEGAPVPPVAINEALNVARDMLRNGKPDKFDARFLSYALLISRTGAEKEVVGAHPREEEIVAELERRLEARLAGYALDEEGLMHVEVAPSGGAEGVYVAFNERARWESGALVRRTYLVLALGTVLLIGATYLILRALVLRPLERLESASEAVAAGQPPPPVPVPRGGGEMARLIDNFNRMASEVHEYQGHLEDRVMETLERVSATERRLVVAQRLAATGTLAAGFAHEINNPLGGILNAVRKLRDGDLSPERREQYFELVQDGVDRIRTLVERMLHFTPHEREPAPVDVAETCRRAHALATHRAEEKNVALDLTLREPLEGVVGDAQELTQAVLNLVLNAVDAIPPGRPGRVEVRALTTGDEVHIEVEDDGVGMDQETLQRAVDLFFSTKPEGEGTGLGLGIVQYIVIDHGGQLQLESTPGSGTLVRLRLPRGIDK
ncbi:MAG: ATP-binding protein [Planctomycetota bacterium]